jgi:serine-type D-Ala-D-Ala carboxypeptidase (penicillin-binding protein 5/6)
LSVKRVTTIKISKINGALGFFLAVMLLAKISSAEAKSVKHARPSSSITAQAVYAVDYTNREVLYSRNAKKSFYPASTTKLLTALVVLDRMSLSDQVSVSRSAAGVAPTKAGLTRGAAYSVGDLLKVLLATSANDAGVALAEAVAGSEPAFAALMNKKAKALGAYNSHFENATGLPDRRQVTTAYDLSVITRAAMSNKFIASVMKKKIVTITGSDNRVITRQNHNKLLWRMDEPCVLGKTGYTKTAGHCYAGIAYYDDRRISVVILKSRKPWQDLCLILGGK